MEYLYSKYDEIAIRLVGCDYKQYFRHYPNSLYSNYPGIAESITADLPSNNNNHVRYRTLLVHRLSEMIHKFCSIVFMPECVHQDQYILFKENLEAMIREESVPLSYSYYNKINTERLNAKSLLAELSCHIMNNVYSDNEQQSLYMKYYQQRPWELWKTYQKMLKTGSVQNIVNTPRIDLTEFSTRYGPATIEELVNMQTNPLYNTNVETKILMMPTFSGINAEEFTPYPV